MGQNKRTSPSDRWIQDWIESEFDKNGRQLTEEFISQKVPIFILYSQLNQSIRQPHDFSRLGIVDWGKLVLTEERSAERCQCCLHSDRRNIDRRVTIGKNIYPIFCLPYNDFNSDRLSDTRREWINESIIIVMEALRDGHFKDQGIPISHWMNTVLENTFSTHRRDERREVKRFFGVGLAESADSIGVAERGRYLSHEHAMAKAELQRILPEHDKDNAEFVVERDWGSDAIRPVELTVRSGTGDAAEYHAWTAIQQLQDLSSARGRKWASFFGAHTLQPLMPPIIRETVAPLLKSMRHDPVEGPMWTAIMDRLVFGSKAVHKAGAINMTALVGELRNGAFKQPDPLRRVSFTRKIDAIGRVRSISKADTVSDIEWMTRVLKMAIFDRFTASINDGHLDEVEADEPVNAWDDPWPDTWNVSLREEMAHLDYPVDDKFQFIEKLGRYFLLRLGWRPRKPGLASERKLSKDEWLELTAQWEARVGWGKGRDPNADSNGDDMSASYSAWRGAGGDMFGSEKYFSWRFNKRDRVQDANAEFDEWRNNGELGISGAAE